MRLEFPVITREYVRARRHEDFRIRYVHTSVECDLEELSASECPLVMSWTPEISLPASEPEELRLHDGRTFRPASYRWDGGERLAAAYLPSIKEQSRSAKEAFADLYREFLSPNVPLLPRQEAIDWQSVRHGLVGRTAQSMRLNCRA